MRLLEAALDILRSHQAIMAAAQRGAISVNRAVYWARELVSGRASPEDLDQLGAPGVMAAAGRNEFMAQQGALSDQVMSILSELRGVLSSLPGGPQAEPAPESFYRLFPDYAARAGLTGQPFEPPNTLTGRPGGHYPAVNPPLAYPGEDQGQPNRQPVTWDGYVTGSGAFTSEIGQPPSGPPGGRQFATPPSPPDYTGPSMDDGFAASDDDFDDDEWVWVPDGFDSVEEYEASGSREVDSLWPTPDRKAAEQAWADYFAAAGQADELSIEDVHEALFGDAGFDG
jgi:hypothetical protein